MTRLMSLTDRLFPAHSSAFSGSAASSSLASSGSVSVSRCSSTASAASTAAASARCQPSSHPHGAPSGTGTRAPVSLTAAATSVAARCGSAHRPGPCATTTCRTGAPLKRARPTTADCGLDSPGRPAETITDGRCAAMNSGAASRYWYPVSAFGPRRAPDDGSASTGHPARSAS